jgi:hypothetical protein
VELSLGQTQRALERYQQSLQLREQIRQQLGDSPECLRDLCFSHAKLAVTYDKLSNRTAAFSHAKTSLEFARELVDTYGDTPDNCKLVIDCESLCRQFSENQG